MVLRQPDGTLINLDLVSCILPLGENTYQVWLVGDPDYIEITQKEYDLIVKFWVGKWEED